MRRALRPALCLATLAALAAPAGAQPIRIEAGGSGRTLTVSGDARVEAPPDRAVIRIGVNTEGREPAATLSAHERDVQRVLTAVRGLGLGDRDLTIEALSLGERWGERGVREGYVATRVVAVTVDDLRLVPDIVATAVSEGANRLDGLFYTVQNPARFQDQALAEAFGRARAKAERLAEAAGLEVGRVVEVHEQGVMPPMPLARGGMMGDAAAVSVAPMPGAYSAGHSVIHAAVVVTFQLED